MQKCFVKTVLKVLELSAIVVLSFLFKHLYDSVPLLVSNRSGNGKSLRLYRSEIVRMTNS